MITSRSVHKWIGISLGIALLVWLVSGVWMVLPTSYQQNWEGGFTQWPAAAVAPAEAVAAASGGALESVRSINMWAVADRLFYRVFLTTGPAQLIDATTGEPVTIDPGLAEQIARAVFGLPEAPIDTVERVDQYSVRYAGGPLPALRVVFADGNKTVAYVGVADGTVLGGGTAHRIRSFVAGIHTFYPLRILVSAKGEKGALILAGVISIVGVLTGYWLALPRRWRGRWSGTQKGA
jgi:Na+-transporting NADH:ubiquinone oxidoreductase subunit F